MNVKEIMIGEVDTDWAASGLIVFRHGTLKEHTANNRKGMSPMN